VGLNVESFDIGLSAKVRSPWEILKHSTPW